MAQSDPTRYRPTQPGLTGGVFGFLGRLFVTTPAYRGEGQPQPHARGGLLGGLFGGGTPVYRQAPPEPAPSGEPTPGSEPGESTAGDDPACPSGPLTIVIATD